jgi:phosphoglycolate phosphatase
MRFNSHQTHLVMFDLDGTLLDTVPDISVALDRALSDCGYASAGLAAVRSWVGNGSRVLIERALASAGNCIEAQLNSADVERVQQHFFEHYEHSCCDQLQPYPGVLEALESLQAKNIAMACVTNKPSRFSGKVLAAAGMAHYFGLTLSGDSLPRRKPGPMPLQHALSFFNCAATSALMVGDSRNDILAALAAGVPCLAVDYGYNHGQPLPQPDSGAHDAPDGLVSSLDIFFNS